MIERFLATEDYLRMSLQHQHPPRPADPGLLWSRPRIKLIKVYLKSSLRFKSLKKGMRYLICENNSYKKTPMSILHGKDGCTEQESTLFEDGKCFLNISPFLTWARYYLRFLTVRVGISISVFHTINSHPGDPIWEFLNRNVKFIPFVPSSDFWKLQLCGFSKRPQLRYIYAAERTMVPYNSTTKSFTFVGLSDNPVLRPLLFVVFLCVYIITLCGNAFIILAYRFSHNLQTPMYFFLSNFSLLEICYVTTISPKMLSLFFVDWNPACSRISFPECVIQMYCTFVLGGTEFCILAAMAYDRYNAICHPLLYTAIMNRRTCIHSIAGSYLLGSGNGLTHTVLTFRLPFCQSTKIDSFFCDIPALLKLACADTRVNEAVIFVGSGGLVFMTLLIITISYGKIIIIILHICSASGRKKTFSTCSSHLIVVILFYGSVFYIYMKPGSSYAIEDKVVSVVYTIITPLLNPFIYSLRNNEVKMAGQKIWHQICASQQHSTKRMHHDLVA
ncbi:olfactory receptor 5J3-like [Gastrophryne carolinensis]